MNLTNQLIILAIQKKSTMKKIIPLLLLFPLFMQSQDIFQKEITYTLPFGISDMVMLPDNSYIGCGTISDYPDSAMSVVFKADSLMQVQWCKRLKMLTLDDFMCITPLNDGNYLIVGASRHESGLDYGGSLYMIDVSGNVIWNRLYSKDYDDRTIGVFEQEDQTLVQFIRHGVFGEPTKILKTDASGNILDQFTIKTLPANKGASGECVIMHSSGNYFLAGVSSYNAVGNNIFFVAKTTDNSLEWYQEYDFGRENARAYGIAEASDGNIVVTGNAADSINSSVNNIAVMKIDPITGSVIWTKEIKQPDPFNQTGYGVHPLTDNELMLYGRANTNDGTQAFAARLDAGGNVIWAQEYGSGTYNIFGYGRSLSLDRYLFIGKNALYGGTYVVQTEPDGSTPCFSGNLNLTAYDISANVLSPQTVIEDPGLQMLSPEYEVSTLTLSQNIFCTGMVAIQEKPTLSHVRIYPNPAHQFVTVENIEGGNAIEIYSISGALCFQSDLHGQNEMIEPHVGPGLYFIRIINRQRQILYRQKMIIY